VNERDIADTAAIDWLVECVNEYSTPTREAAGELDRALTRLPGGPSEASSLTPDDLIRVADGWFEVFRVAPEPEAVAAELNQLLMRATPTVTAISDGDSVTSMVALAPETDAATRLSVWGALALLNTTATLGVSRIGVCTGDRCLDVYVDRSPRHNRRFCSQLCQTRERVNRYRGRKADAVSHM
jgi:predicted RNA-binding Zn ribbon-like protein